MSRLVSVDDVNRVLKEHWLSGTVAHRIIDSISESIDKLPSVEQEETVWVPIDEEPHEDYECNNCGRVVSVCSVNIDPNEVYKFCPSCGAVVRPGKIKEEIQMTDELKNVLKNSKHISNFLTCTNPVVHSLCKAA